MSAAVEGPIESLEKGPASVEQGAAGFPMGIVLGLALWSVCVAALSGLAVWHFAKQQWDHDLIMRPPVVVVDTFGWIKGAGTGATIQDRYTDGANRLNDAVKQLKAHGALVLDVGAVRAAPEEVRLQTPESSKSAAPADGGSQP